ncbi:hypothetical protein [Mesobacterium pallidum]|uniref:hypothetical protein n=1 Tax=Mesobacterium pallidum TaxID=2872037 RepID=UPI001EE1B00C|nr:hypothetical protein [Mesobacterium pallidum]
MQSSQRAEAISDMAEATGFYHRMTDHMAVFHPRGRRLVVSFDAEVSDPAEAMRAPWGHDHFDRLGLSHLALAMTGAEDGFRHVDVDTCFDQLLDCRFFDQFQDVLFIGSGTGAEAALRYARTVPGCRVAAFGPRRSAPGISASRYADPQAGAARAARAQVFYDPMMPEDRDAARALAGPAAELIRLPGTGHPVPLALGQPGLVSQVAEAVLEDRFDRAELSAQLRARHDKPSYVRRLLTRAIEAGHWRLAEQVLVSVSAQHPEWGFRTVNLMLNRARRQEKRARVRARLERHEDAAQGTSPGHVSLFERLQMG